jgi:hypothetical protein
VKTIQFGPFSLPAPYADDLPPLSTEERDALKADIQARGVVVPVVVGDRGLIDGFHRASLAAELGIAWESVPRIERAGLGEEEERQLAADLNLHRRHLSKEARREHALRLRREGKSYREIGERLGVDAATAMRDVKESTVANSTVDQPAEPLPDTTIGKDGKKRAASKPRAPKPPETPKPAPAGTPSVEPKRKPGPDADLLLCQPEKPGPWLKEALARVKDSGRAYLIVPSEPEQLTAYLYLVTQQKRLTLSNILACGLTTDPAPAGAIGYQQNWLAVIYLHGPDASALNLPLSREGFAFNGIQHGALFERLIFHAGFQGAKFLDPFSNTDILTAATRRGCEILEAAR